MKDRLVECAMTLALMSALFTACSPRSDRSANERLVQELTDTLTLLSKEVDLNGFGVAIVSEKGVLYQNGFGFADVAAQKKYTDSTLQALASISKTFIGLAVLKVQLTVVGLRQRVSGQRDCRVGVERHVGEARRLGEVPPGVGVPGVDACAAVARSPFHSCLETVDPLGIEGIGADCCGHALERGWLRYAQVIAA